MLPFTKDHTKLQWKPQWYENKTTKQQTTCLNPWCIGMETCPWCPIGLDKVLEFTPPPSQKLHNACEQNDVQYLLHLGPALGSVDGMVAYANEQEEATIFLFRTAQILTKEEWQCARQRRLFADVSMGEDLQEWCRFARTKQTGHTMHYNRYVAVIPIQEYKTKLDQMIKEIMQRYVTDLLTGHLLQLTPKSTTPPLTVTTTQPLPLAFVEPKSRHLLYIIAWKNHQPFGFLMQPPLPVPSYDLLHKTYPQQVHPYPSSKQNWHAFLKAHRIPITFRTTVIKRAAASLIALQNTYGYVFFPDPSNNNIKGTTANEIKIAASSSASSSSTRSAKLMYDAQLHRFKLE